MLYQANKRIKKIYQIWNPITPYFIVEIFFIKFNYINLDNGNVEWNHACGGAKEGAHFGDEKQ